MSLKNPVTRPTIDPGTVRPASEQCLCKSTGHLSVSHLLSLNVIHIKGINNGFKVVLRSHGSLVSASHATCHFMSVSPSPLNMAHSLTTTALSEETVTSAESL
jgi:hypothetical protein